LSKCAESQYDMLISFLSLSSSSHDLTLSTPICCMSPTKFPSALKKLHVLNEE
jgi:hypothetical protein